MRGRLLPFVAVVILPLRMLSSANEPSAPLRACAGGLKVGTPCVGSDISRIIAFSTAGGIVSGTSSESFGGRVGRLVTETRNGVTTEYLFDPDDELRIAIDGEHVVGVQVIARQPH